MATGFWWPIAGSRQWSEEQAQEFAEASAAQITAAHESLHAARELTAEESAELRAVQQRFKKIKADLETARQRPAEVGFWLKLTGGVLAALGLVTIRLGH
ncbi:hypothetical protein [Bythopirellula polymerisocia]|uniref:hypothetical protein n=1 Tax=Bythopirellula polymerisocia TaxID=2528003 RepID=UPI0011B51748|nr:hypothetical protein [Bythopirellula polymerisocia]